jgi:hypothetical protein
VAPDGMEYSCDDAGDEGATALFKRVDPGAGNILGFAEEESRATRRMAHRGYVDELGVDGTGAKYCYGDLARPYLLRILLQERAYRR